MRKHFTAYNNKQAFKAFLFFCLFMLLGGIAHAQYATGGSSPYRDQVLWLTWGDGTNGTSGQPLNVGASSGATIQVAGNSTLNVQCSITSITHSGGGTAQLNSYAPGGWKGDVLDDLYNIGGTGKEYNGDINNNQLVNGISRTGGIADFTIGCTAKLDGQSYRLNGLVMADAEAINTTDEYVEATAKGIWNVVEMPKNPGAGTYMARKTNNIDSQTIRFGPGTDDGTAAVTFLSFTKPKDNVSMDFSIKGGGTTAIAIGLLAPYSDFGDAPASYGDAMHLVQDLQFQDDHLAADDQQHDLNDSGYQSGGLAPSKVDYIGSQGTDTELDQKYDNNAVGDDNYPTKGSNEEDAWPDNYTITVLQENETLSESVACTGTGTVAGWIDFDQNGTFDADERAEAPCTGGEADFTWTTPSKLTPGNTFVRLRYSTDPAAIDSPTGTAPDGEVEDHQIEITAPQLSVTKSSNAASGTWSVDEPNPKYTLTVTNNSPVATGDPTNGVPVEPVTVKDQLPTGIEPDWTGTHTTNGWSCTFTGQEVSCTSSDLIAASGESGDQTTIQLQVQITEDAIGEVTNYASVGGGRDPDFGGSPPQPGSSCTDGEHCTKYTVTIEQSPKLTVNKELRNAPSPIVEGSELEYTITATNSGNVTLSNVDITDSKITPGTKSCGTLDLGDECTLTGTYVVSSSDVDAGEVVNTATATGDDPTGSPVEDNDKVTEPIPLADLAVSKNVDNATPNVGEDITFTVAVTNNGSAEATNVSITDQLPSGYSFQGATASQGSYSSGPGIWNVGTIANGATATLDITATVLASGPYENTASVNNSDQEDPDSGNDEDTSEPNPSASADVEVTKSLITGGPFTVAQEIQYTLVVSNNGPSDATNIQVTDSPQNLTITELSGGPGCPNFSCMIPSLASGNSTTFTITATIDNAGAFDNIAAALADQYDPNEDNNTDDSGNDGNADPEADLGITKTVSPQAPTVEEEVTFTLSASNTGPSDATGVNVDDQLPAGYDYLSSNTATGSYDEGSGRWTIGSLADGGTATLNITAKVLAGGTAYNNTATINGNENDPNPDNDTDDAEPNPVPSADVSLEKTLDTGGPYNAGQQVNYTLTMVNNGPSEATGIAVTDIPTNLTIDNVSGSDCNGFPCTIPTLADGDQTTINITGTIIAAGAFGNTATATPNEDDPDETNNTDQDGDSGNASVDIAVTKTLDTAGPYNAGEQVDYTITIANNGPSEATGILVEEVPTNVTIDKVSGSGCSGFPCTIPTLANGDQTTIAVTASIDAKGVFDNEVTASPTEHDPDPTNNKDNDGDEGELSSDVSIDKTLETAAPYVAGQELSYTLTVANGGPSEATEIVVEDSPTNLTITEVSGGGCGSFPCTIASLADGAQQTISVTATIDGAGSFTNAATVTPKTPDPNPDDNEDDDPGNGGEADASADISIDKALDTAGPFSAGQEVQYTITVSNAGPSAAQNVTVTENPTNLTVTDIGGGGCNSFPCDLASIANGGQKVINVTATIDAEGPFQNGVTVTSNTNDPDPGDNEDDDPENGGNAGTSSDVSIDKTLETSGPYVVGQEINYTLTVSNTGPSEAMAIEVTDTPENLTITEISGAGCSSFPCTIETLASEEETTISVAATIDEEGAFTNAATVETEIPDPDPNNNEDDDPDNGGEADAPIVATNDDYGSMPGGADYPNLGVIFTNDEMDGDPIAPPKTTLELLDELPEGMGINPETGQFSVGPETPAGTYTFDYQICAVDNPDNCDTATVTLVVEPPSADISMDKTLDTEGPYVAGQEITYTLAVANAGPSEATNIEVTDSPDNLTIMEITGGGCSGFPCTVAGPLPAGDQQEITVTATIDAAGSFDNVATGTPAEDDPSPENNTDDENNGGQAAAPELRITKQTQNLTARPGGFVPYTITIDNLSEVAVSGVQLVDTPAPGLSYVAQSLGVRDTDNAGLVEGLRPLTVGQLDIPAGGQAAVSYVMRIGATALPGELRNVAVAARNGSNISNEDEASVILEGDPIMDDTRILGTVFRDHDRDGWQDKATATGLQVQGGFAPDAYVPGSTTINRGMGLESIPDRSTPLLSGLALGDLEGRGSVGASPDRITVRQQLRSPDLTDNFTLTSDEGTRLQMDSTGATSRNPKGALKRGTNSQRLEVDRSLKELDSGQYQLTYRISNAGYNDWGIPGTRLATPRGLIIETDGFGRYHIEAIEVDSWRRGRNYVVKVDDSSLPRGSRYTTENPLVRRVTQGLPVRFDFGIWWPSADVSIAKTLVADSSYHSGQPVTYRLRIANDGPTPAQDIRLIEAPENLSITRVSGAGCDTLPCSIPGPLAPGEHRALTVEAQIDTTGQFTNTAEVWAGQPDPAPGNNSAQVSAVAGADTMAKPAPVPPAPCEGAEILPKSVHFETDKAELAPPSKQLLGPLSTFLEGRPECRLKVTGHTDHDLGHDYNKALSERRAQAIATYLKARGVPADRIEYAGVSYDEPAVDETDVLDKARNRRASFTLQPGDSAAELRTAIEDLQVDPEPRPWDYVFDFRHHAVPTQLHFPEGSAALNFVSKYLLKRIRLALGAEPGGTVTFGLSASGDTALDRRREQALGQALAAGGLETDRFRIGTSEEASGPVSITYSSEESLILVDQADDIRLAGDKRYRSLLEKAWQMLRSRRDGPLLNDGEASRPEPAHVPLKGDAMSHTMKDLLNQLEPPRSFSLPLTTGRDGRGWFVSH